MGTPASVAECPRPECRGASTVQDTRRDKTWYVRRMRCCEKCGHIWSTAEVPFQMLKRTMKLDAFIQELR